MSANCVICGKHTFQKEDDSNWLVTCGTKKCMQAVIDNVGKELHGRKDSIKPANSAVTDDSQIEPTEQSLDSVGNPISERHTKSFQESLGEMKIPNNFRDIATEGLVHAETALFEHSKVARLRLSKLSQAIHKMEGRVFSDEFIETIPPEELMDHYMSLHKIDRNLLGYLENVHEMVSDEVKFDQLANLLQTQIESGDEKGGTVIAKTLRTAGNLSDKGRAILHMAEKLMHDRMEEKVNDDGDTIDINKEDS